VNHNCKTWMEGREKRDGDGDGESDEDERHSRRPKTRVRGKSFKCASPASTIDQPSLVERMKGHGG
jgi:hypothetical protein